jgi:hypothetical protein
MILSWLPRGATPCGAQTVKGCEGLKMKNRSAVFLLIAVAFLTLSSPVNGGVEWDVKETLNLESPPVDLAASLNGKYIYVLTSQGSILIYSVEGKLKDMISVGRQVDGLKVGPWEDVILLTSKKNKQVQIVLLDFIKDIDLSHSPFKGPADAPVEIAVFSDFQ